MTIKKQAETKKKAVVKSTTSVKAKATIRETAQQVRKKKSSTLADKQSNDVLTPFVLRRVWPD